MPLDPDVPPKRYVARAWRPEALLFVPFGLMLLALLGAALAEVDGPLPLATKVFVGLVSLTLGVLSLVSSAYGLAGWMELERREGVWQLTRGVGPLRRVRSFGRVAGTERMAREWGSYFSMPDAAGRHLLVALVRGEELRIGQGLTLSDADFEELEGLLMAWQREGQPPAAP
jgi:hypothetical protein